MKHRLAIVLALTAALALVGVALALAGCSGGSSSNYTQERTTLSGADIAYEYPTGYQMPSGGIGVNAVTYLHYLGKVEMYNADVMLFIETDNITPYQTAADMLEQSITAIMKNTQGFQLIKRTTTKVAGYDAELFAFTATFSDTPLDSTTTTTWVAYFTRGDRVWELGVMADSDIGDVAKTEYQHLVDSFSFN